MASRTRSMLLGIFILSVVHNVYGQKLNFPNPLKYDRGCGLEEPDNLTVTGEVTLIPEDFLMFQPKVIIQKSMELCTVDLLTCGENATVTDATLCYCTKSADDVYSFYVRTQPGTKESGFVLQAIVPSRDKFSGLAGIMDVGEIPYKIDNSVNMTATYRLNNGETKLLNPVETIHVCQGELTKVEICLSNLEDGSKLTLAMDGQVTHTTKSCVEVLKQFDFSSVSSYLARFSYSQIRRCPHPQEYTLEIKQCDSDLITPVPMTSPTATTTSEPITSEVPNTTADITSVEPSPTAEETTTEPTTPEPTTPEPTTPEPTTPPTTPPTTTTLAPTTTELITPANVCAMREGYEARQVVTLEGKELLCDTASDGGKWIVIQRRQTKEVDFYVGWHYYKAGFGNIRGNFWFGLDNIHELCNKESPCELRVDVEFKERNSNGTWRTFYLEDESENYKLHVSDYEDGSYFDSLSYHDGAEFSTKDKDNDGQRSRNCAEKHKGGWWYTGRDCRRSNLNGQWGQFDGTGMTWWLVSTPYNSVSYSEMKVRPRQLSMK